jgi:hypothetical protein
VESKSPPSRPVVGVPALHPRFSRVLSHVYEEGDTSEVDVASLSTLTHVATYIRGEVMLWGNSYSSQALRTSKL